MGTRLVSCWVGCCLLGGVALGLGPSASLLGAAYSLRDLGPLADLPGADEAHPTAVSPDGEVVGANALQGYYRAFRFDGAMLGLGTLGGGESFAADINKGGVIVGFSHDPSVNLRGFIWTEGGTDGVPGNPEMLGLGTFGGDESKALGINSAGYVTGYAETSNRAHAFIYKDGVMTDLGDRISSSRHSFGFAINEADHVAGVLYNGGGTVPEAFLYIGPTVQMLGDLGGGQSFALDVNDADVVVGYSLLSDGLREHAFRYASGGMEDLGTLGGNYSYGLAINNRGEIIGGSFVDAAEASYHAFIWRDGVMTDLNELLDGSGDGWELIEARAINDLGQIAGEGLFGAERRAFLLTPDTVVPGPRITDVSVDGNDVRVTFETAVGGRYNLESSTRNALDVWFIVEADLPGTGQPLSVNHPNGAGQERRFYRVVRTSP